MKKNIIKASSKALIAFILLWVAINIPSYFLGVDASVLKSFDDSQGKKDLAEFYVSTAKIDVAEMLLDSTKADDAQMRASISQMREATPLLKLTGARDAFFYENLNNLDPKDFKDQSAYEFFAVSSNINIALSALNKSTLPLVGDILKLRSLNTTLLPPAFSSAGAPYSASIIITAILVENNALNSAMLKDIATNIPLLESDSQRQLAFENYCLGLLYFSKTMSMGELSELLAKLNNLNELSLLAKAFATGQGFALGDLSSAFLLYPNGAETISYLNAENPDSYADYIEASNYSQAAVEKLLSENLAIYKAPSYMKIVPMPFQGIFASLSASATSFALFLKILLIFIASYLLLSLNIRHKDTPNWYSPLALLRGGLGAIVLCSLICLAVEPAVFNYENTTENPAEIKLAIQDLNTLIGENDIMKFNMDTATILTLSLFLLMQFVIFATCLIKIATIKKMAISPSVKLELLNNEDNLFDLGLYVGLGGTVLSLIMLSLSMMNTALMAGYSSTLFGIMFTALLKIAFVRPYRHKLLLEVARTN